mmetsp:Transcript_12029/g.18462  ORF Transcript_12029/g.18462 Transcript_12029/m.18462 type:complete len:516 (+) Transcript_12029:73-1620(+)
MRSSSLISCSAAVLSTSTAVVGLSLHRPSTYHTNSLTSPILRSNTALRLGDLDDLSDYGKSRVNSELDSLISKRDAIKKNVVANTKPDDDTPPIDEMSDDDIAKMLSDEADIDEMFSKDYVPTFATKRGPSRSGLSSGESGGVLDGEEEDDEDRALFVDWTEDYDDENEFHIPNRIGFTTAEWGDKKKGFVAGKLKKKDRKAGKFNKSDLKKAYEKLQQNGVSFVETSESLSFAEAFLNKFFDECEHGDRPLVASTFANPWKHAIKTKSLPRRGSKAVVDAAEACCERMGVSSMSLYQVKNPYFYIGGTSALAEGMLDVISDDHSRYVGCINISTSKLAKLQRQLRAQGEFVATNQFDFSLTNRKSMAMIEACKKMNITPLCTNVLDGGLASGKYTSVNPTGGEVSKGEGDTGPYSVRTLEKLDTLFKVQDSLKEKVNSRIGDKLSKFDSGKAPKINREITTTQIAINYVKAKGAVPLVPVNNVKMANEVLGCLGWELTEEEVLELDKACKTCGV